MNERELTQIAEVIRQVIREESQLGPRWVDIDDYCKRVKRSRATVLRWVKQGKIKSRKRGHQTLCEI